MSLNLFRRHILSNPTVQNRTVDGLLQLIENERYNYLFNDLIFCYFRFASIKYCDQKKNI